MEQGGLHGILLGGLDGLGSHHRLFLRAYCLWTDGERVHAGEFHFPVNLRNRLDDHFQRNRALFSNGGAGRFGRCHRNEGAPVSFDCSP